MIHGWGPIGDVHVKAVTELRPGHPGFEKWLVMLHGMAADGLTKPDLQPYSFVHGALFLTESDSYLIGPDRKSTRLNSSHVAISYAVFCLKKKITRISILQLGVRIHEERPNHAKWYEMEENRRFDVEYTSILQSLATI